MSPAAWLFDLDGVLTPTAALHARAWKATFDPVLVQLGDDRPFDIATDYPAHVDGKARDDGVRDLMAARGLDLPDGGPDDGPDALTVHGVAARKDAAFAAELADGVEAFPDAREVLELLARAGVPTAVVSASRHCEEVVAAAGIGDLLDVRIDGVTAAQDDLAGKPAPDTFLAAARRLGVEASACAVVEDAVAGVAAGAAGGFALVVGVDRADGARTEGLRQAGAERVVALLTELVEAGLVPGGQA